jgi:cold shock CspA family protein
VASGTVVRFDRRRGYGFVAPDDGGEDVFVHQNNINMEGFRYLQVGERVNYELEVGEKGMKAVQVALTEPRVERAPGSRDEDFGARDSRDAMDEGNGGGFRQRQPRPPRERERERAPRPARGGDDSGSADKLRRKLERLVNLLVEKGVLAPGELDGIEGGTPAKTSESEA